MCLWTFKHKNFIVRICKSTAFYKVNGATEKKMSCLSSQSEEKGKDRKVKWLIFKSSFNVQNYPSPTHIDSQWHYLNFIQNV